MRRTAIVSLSLALCLAACQAPHSTRPETKPPTTTAAMSKNAYPAAKTVAQVDDYHGTKVADPYRWLEDIDSPDTRAWIEAENKLTFERLNRIPGRDRLKRRLTELWNYERYGAPEKYGSRYFYTRNDGLQNQAVLYVADALDAPPRVLLDPNTLSADGTIALKSYAVSDDGKHLAYGLSSGGSDWEEWHVLDVDTGKPTDDVLKWVKFSGASWRRDGTGFYYSRYEEPKGGNALKTANTFQKLCFHRLGTPQKDDLVVYEDTEHPDWLFSGSVTDDGRYLVITVSRFADNHTRVLYRDLGKREREATIEPLLDNWDAEYRFLGNARHTFYFVTDKDAPRYRLIAVDAGKSGKTEIKQVVPEAAETLLNARVVHHSFINEYMKDAHSEVRRFDLKGKPIGTIALPGLGTAAGFTGRTDDTETFYVYTSFTAPPTVYRFDLAGGKNEVFRAPKVAFDPAQFETRQVFYESRDGTRVPMFITAKKGIAQNGANPTILYGYGGFNISLQPSFSPAALAWLDLGGVYAVANLRGGGEYGRAWHEAGMKTHKQNVFDDFIAAAEYLIREKYTSPQRLAIRGGSNGGLLVAAVELQRPELFGAAVPQVGVLDMLRFRDFTIGKAWESDYGSVDNPEEFKALYAYSPLQNVKPGVDYPPTLIITGDHDDRVFPAHSFKFAAAMQAADPNGKPILIRIETRAGHGQGKPTAMQIDEATDIFAFILDSFGMAH
ncbi:MAG TPA: prolyl oligopeptidase family serine peptidase [Rudaea sp.]|nr:prolyl oligopeptidase family serine peptidase [Rudaea sp.]